MVKKNLNLAESARVAQAYFTFVDEENRNPAMELFKLLFDRDYGFDEAILAAKNGILSSSAGVNEHALGLFNCLIV